MEQQKQKNFAAILAIGDKYKIVDEMATIEGRTFTSGFICLSEICETFGLENSLREFGYLEEMIERGWIIYSCPVIIPSMIRTSKDCVD